MLLNRWVVDSPGLIAVTIIGVGVFPDKLSAVAIKGAACISIPFCTENLLDFFIVTAIDGSVGRRHIHPVIILEYNTEMIILIPDRKSTRLNSSHVAITYAVFC